MTITEIKPGKHNTKYIFVDNEFAFSAYDDIIYKYSLSVGLKTDAAALQKAKDEQNKLYAKERALDILSRAALSHKGLFLKLKQKGIEDKYAEFACNYCIEQGFINDAAILPDIINHLLCDKKYGSRRVMSYLLQKGFEKDMISDALNELSHDSTDDIVSLINASNTDFEDRKSVSKLYQKLLRKGFSYSEIKSSIMKYTDMEIDDGE